MWTFFFDEKTPKYINIREYAHDIFELVCHEVKGDSSIAGRFDLGGQSIESLFPLKKRMSSKYSGHIRSSIGRENKITELF